MYFCILFSYTNMNVKQLQLKKISKQHYSLKHYVYALRSMLQLFADVPEKYKTHLNKMVYKKI
jgi:hypothetical protein